MLIYEHLSCKEEKFMTISYKRLWVMLAHREMSKAELRRQAGLSPATFTKLRRNQPVSMEVLMKIAQSLGCNIGDMMDFIDQPKENEIEL